MNPFAPLKMPPPEFAEPSAGNADEGAPEGVTMSSRFVEDGDDVVGKEVLGLALTSMTFEELRAAEEVLRDEEGDW